MQNMRSHFFLRVCGCPFVGLRVFLPKYLLVSMSLGLFFLFVYLFVCHLHVTVIIFAMYRSCYFHKSSPIFFYFIFSSVQWVRIQNIEFKQHDLLLPVSCVGKLFEITIHHIVLFVL